MWRAVSLQAEFSIDLSVNKASIGPDSSRSFNVVFVVESGGAASTSPCLKFKLRPWCVELRLLNWRNHSIGCYSVAEPVSVDV